MRFVEINLFGVYVAPMALMLVAAWLILIPLRRVASRFGLQRHVWHPALFEFAVYMIVLSCIVLAVGRGDTDVHCRTATRNPQAKRGADLRPRREARCARQGVCAWWPLLITLATVVIAAVLARAMWNTYLGTPWTRDGRVRVYVVTIAPQIAGTITELPVTTISSCTRAIC